MTRAIGCACTLLLLTGCFTVRHEYDGDVLLTSSGRVQGFDVERVRHFKAHDRQFFWLHGGFPVGEDLNAAALAASRAGDHDAVVNLRIHDGQDLLDMAVTHVFCGLSLLCGTWSAWAEGDIADLAPMQVPAPPAAIRHRPPSPTFSRPATTAEESSR